MQEEMTDLMPEIAARRPSPSESGMSLLSVVVAFGITGILAGMMTIFFSNSMSFANDITVRNNLEDLRRLVRIGTNCQLTVAAKPATCGAGTLLELKKGSAKKPTTFVDIPYSKFGKYDLKASCTAVAHEYNIEVRRGFGSWKKLFPADLPFTCRGD